MANTHMKLCSTLLSIREMQIKISMRYYITSVRMAMVNKSADGKCWRVCGENWTLLSFPWECKLIQPLWRTVFWSLKKVGIKLTYDPTIQLLGICPGEIIIEKDACNWIFIAALFTIARIWKQPCCSSTDEWIKKM